MKKFINLFIIWSAIFPSQLAAQVLTQRQHLPLTTDSLLGYKLPYVAISDSSRYLGWDFSYLSIDSAEVIEMNYFASSTDTMYIGLHRERANSYYHFAKDTLWQTGYETSHTHVRYTSPLPLLHFPFAYSDTMQGIFFGNGQYCHILPLSIAGSYTTCVDAIGKLVLPEMEIDSIIRIHQQIRYNEQKTMRYSIEENRYLWYSPYCRYPLLEAVTVKTTKDSDSISYAALYYLPQEQEDVQERKDVEQDLQAELADSLITEVSFMPNPVFTDLQVNYSLVRPAQVYISVHYNGGISTYQTPIRKEEEGVHFVTISMAGMPVGNYVVYIHADDMIVSGNIIKL